MSAASSSHGSPPPARTVAGLFAGIGGIELGLHEAGFRSTLLCEIDVFAAAVLKAQMPGVELVADVAEVESVAGATIVTAGFPCQDLSQAGRTAGITGERSGLVGHVFRLLDEADPDWLVLENVPFMLQLDRGSAMRYLTEQLEERGFSWAYRVVDARAFGLPQRRQRVIVVASRRHDPRNVLFAEDAEEPLFDERGEGVACGFYWTEGLRGLGWAVDAVPTLKGGSTVGIPSPPAVWIPGEGVFTPHIKDAERLQGFDADWTAPAVKDATLRNGPRWKLVGNAVAVPVATWLGGRLRNPGTYDPEDDVLLAETGRWPTAAWGADGERRVTEMSKWPVRTPTKPLEEFLQEDLRPLSARATAGFLRRLKAGSLNRPAEFEADLEAHLVKQQALLVPAAA